MGWRVHVSGQRQTPKKREWYMCTSYLTSTFLLSSGQGSSSACLKTGIFPCPMPQSSYWQRRPKVWYCSVPAPSGTMPQRAWDQRNGQKPEKTLLLFTDNPCEQKPSGEDSGSLCQGQNKWGAALRRNNIIRPTLLSPPYPKAQPVV